MRQALSRSLITVAAASGVLAMTGGYAHADTEAQATTSNSPGVLSGDSIQVPVDAPVNVCGNTVDVVALLNPSMGNGCGNGSAPAHERHAPVPAQHTGAPTQHTGAPVHGKAQHGGRHRKEQSGHHGMRHDEANTTSGSPGVGSGNSVRVPVQAPVTVCGDSIDVVALLNPAMGANCGGEEWTPPPTHPLPPPVRHTPPPTHLTPPPVEQVTPPKHAAATRPVVPVRAQLAETGSGDLGTAGAVSAGLLLSGAMLYRRTRAARV
ncbi:chaplin [Streptomyces sp. RKAG293]|uniref:chaplin n=1 Tax=Streptomyces sp. RKAG293 TaxID=2893403 RepID=UPI00203448CB|nr:chaplin [Streptomyces sp. RKAG293]MCM2420581.1 DUF320 domain-containing protein [Streptomyces sp. RKAG293]